ncbi:hypothetical protein [Reyranella soli]|uniref:Uncharacterized protein n=1 Tax=Reyranella soli TaxID=1230389 RepID=A0A512NLJ1_9HYPH|nr:hypothetical protein [Reyranella soli]GEP59816.1 hypothetical protein RSO01_69820 [Reyranella soli]
MNNIPVGLVSAPLKRGKEKLTSMPHFLLALAVRSRYLAAKARREAHALPGDPIAPRLIEVAEKLEDDAMRNEEEGRSRLAQQGKAAPFPQLDKDAGASGRSCGRPRPAAGGQQP